jgi:hypothetical protein
VSETRERSAQLLPDIPLDRTREAASNGAPFSTSYLGDTADIIFGYGAGTLNHARTYDTTCQGVRIMPIRCRSSLRWWRWEYVRGRQ